jgi:T-complex protein 1 subunit beta
MAEAAILNSEATVDKGENARMSSFVGAIAIADLVKTTLGPKGMDKILQSVSTPNGDITVTNDGATILRSIIIDNPAAKVLVDIARTQDDEVGDGTTSVTVLTGELLREAEKLVSQRIHPMLIIDGWRRATTVARAALEASALDHSDDFELFKIDLFNIARTTLSSKLLTHEKDQFAKLAVDAVLRIRKTLSLESIQIIKKAGGSLKDSYLESGFILNKKIGVGQPRRIEKARILLANTPMDTDKVKIFGTRVRVDSMAKVAEIEAAEKEKMKGKVDKIVSHGINCFINRQLIYNYPEQLFAEAGIMAIEHADFDGIERLAAVTGGEIASTFEHPELVALGECDLIEEIMIGEDRMLRFSGVKAGEACTIVLRGSSSHLLEEAERSLHDALCVLTETMKESKIVFGGGCSEVLMANAVDEEARKTPGKRQLAMEAFARALRTLPTTIADNAGYDSAELVSKVRAAHVAGDIRAGIDIRTGTVGDVQVLGITEALKLKRQVLLSAAEAAEMILRVDDIIKCAPRKRGTDDGHDH